MRCLTRALTRAAQGQRSAVGLQERTQASLAARDIPEPKLPPFSHEPAKYTGPSKQEVIDLRRKHLNPAIMAWYKSPVMITEGRMQYLYDETGRRYLDAFAGIVTVSVGHCHPKVVAAVDRQNHLLQHTTNIYLNNEIAQYAQELTDKMPGNLKVANFTNSGSEANNMAIPLACLYTKVAYFVNSGSEANDMAILLARLYTGNHDLIALRNGYHGITEGLLGVLGHSTWKYNVPSSGGVKHALNPDPYRGRFGNDGPAYAEDVRDVIQTATSGQVAGFISETIQGVGGATPLAEGYLTETYKHVRDAGGVCIADEVQTGFGRTGTKFWGFENQGVIPDIVTGAKGVVPDIVTMAKGIGNGLPLAAVVTTEEIAKTMSQRLHFNTFGGNPVCSAGGRAVLNAIEEDGLQANSAKVGSHIKRGLQALKEKHSIIGDVRGQGLMLGVELVKDRQTKAPAKEETLQAFERMKDMGVLIGKGGLLGNVFRIKPPMCINEQDADFLLEVMDVALSEL